MVTDTPCIWCVAGGFVGIVIMVCCFIRLLVLKTAVKRATKAGVYDEEESIVSDQQQWGSEDLMRERFHGQHIRLKSHCM